MTSFFGKLFGKKEEVITGGSVTDMIEGALDNLIGISGLEFDYKISTDGTEAEREKVFVEIGGLDEELLRARDGALLDAIQLFLTRITQHQLRDERVSIYVDNEGYRDQANQELIDLAEKLKNVAMEKGRPVYFRALPPRDRKVIHQYLAGDPRIKSHSVGEGLYKKIKIFPI